VKEHNTMCSTPDKTRQNFNARRKNVAIATNPRQAHWPPEVSADELASEARPVAATRP